MEYESEGRELERLFIAWRKLPEKTKGAILVLAGVRETPGPGPQTLRHVRKGETPDWLVTVSERPKPPTSEHLKSTHLFRGEFARAYPVPKPRRGYVMANHLKMAECETIVSPTPAGLV